MKNNQKRSTNLPLMVIVFIFITSCTQTTESLPNTTHFSEGEKLNELIENDWERKLKDIPEIASYNVSV